MNFQKYLHTLPEAKEGLGGLPGDYYAKVTYLSGIDASPEHKELAWVETSSIWKNKNVQDIFVYDAEHGRRQMTSSGDVGGFTWLDDDTLLFQSVYARISPQVRQRKKHKFGIAFLSMVAKRSLFETSETSDAVGAFG